MHIIALRRVAVTGLVRCLVGCLLAAGPAGLTFAAAGPVGEQPPLPPGTLPMYVADPVLPAAATDQPGFACFKACGPSCDCVGRVDAHLTTTAAGKTCDWHTIQCKTHSFCAWHDTCYNRCDFQVPGRVDDGRIERSLCYRHCDFACISGSDPAPGSHGWQPESLDPGAPPAKLGLIECTQRLLFNDSVSYDGVLTYAELVGCTPEP